MFNFRKLLAITRKAFVLSFTPSRDDAPANVVDKGHNPFHTVPFFRIIPSDVYGSLSSCRRKIFHSVRSSESVRIKCSCPKTYPQSTRTERGNGTTTFGYLFSTLVYSGNISCAGIIYLSGKQKKNKKTKNCNEKKNRLNALLSLSLSFFFLTRYV